MLISQLLRLASSARFFEGFSPFQNLDMSFQTEKSRTGWLSLCAIRTHHCANKEMFISMQ